MIFAITDLSSQRVAEAYSFLSILRRTDTLMMLPKSFGAFFFYLKFEMQ